MAGNGLVFGADFDPYAAALADTDRSILVPRVADAFMTSDGSQVVDLNPRFGGGYPFTHAAGANLPAAILAWAERREPDSSWLTMTLGVATAKSDKLGRLDRIDLNTEFSAGTAHLR